MTDNIKPIRKEIPVDETLVKMLEEMVEEAKNGDLLSIAGVILDGKGNNINFTSVEITDELKMLGALSILVDTYKLEHLTEWEYDDE